MKFLEHREMGYYSRDIRKTAKKFVMEWLLKSQVVRNLMHAQKQSLSRESAIKVRQNE